MIATDERQAHWDAVYGSKTEAQLSWHQDDPAVSLELIEQSGLTQNTSVIDIGGGTSRLAEALLARGLRDLTVLDLSRVALEANKARLGAMGATVDWIAADITRWTPKRRFDIWHDRAVFHFLTDEADRAAYLAALNKGLRVGGYAMIATFAPDGPEKCSGYPVVRYSPKALAEVLGDGFEPVAHRYSLHHTPWGAEQAFQYSLLRKVR